MLQHHFSIVNLNIVCLCNMCECCYCCCLIYVSLIYCSASCCALAKYSMLCSIIFSKSCFLVMHSFLTCSILSYMGFDSLTLGNIILMLSYYSAYSVTSCLFSNCALTLWNLQMICVNLSFEMFYS